MRKSTFVILPVLVCATLSSSISMAETEKSIDQLRKMTLQEAWAYSQKSHQVHDVEGDFALRNRTRAMFGAIVRVMRGTQDMGIAPAQGQGVEVSQEPTHRELLKQELQELQSKAKTREQQARIVEIKNKLLQLEGYQNPFKRQGFGKMLAHILKQEEARGLRISYGTPHKWSNEILEAYPQDAITGWPKILVALASGNTIHYMRTDLESALEAWMLEQPVASIHYHELFRKALQLANGDVYESVLTMQNILSVNWRRPNREDLAMIRRLKVMHNNWNGGGDKFGFWYHFTGTLLYGYVHGEGAARFAGFIETIGSQILSNFDPEPQESLANKWGGILGNDLSEMVRTRSYAKMETTENDLQETNYLDLTEDFRDRIEHVASDELVIRPMIDADRGQVEGVYLTTKGAKLERCQAEVIIVDKSARRGVVWNRIQNVSLSSDRWFVQPLSARGVTSGEIRVFLTGCGEFYNSVQFP